MKRTRRGIAVIVEIVAFVPFVVGLALGLLADRIRGGRGSLT